MESIQHIKEHPHRRKVFTAEALRFFVKTLNLPYFKILKAFQYCNRKIYKRFELAM